MKSTILSVAGVLLLTAAPLHSVLAQDHSQDEVIALSDPIQVTDQFKVYGDEIGEKKAPTSLSSASKLNFDSREKKDLYFEGVLTQVCQSRGCNFFLDDGETQVQVRFKDYSFFIPTDSAGKKTLVRGDFVQKQDDERGNHVEILATSIKIYNESP